MKNTAKRLMACTLCACLAAASCLAESTQKWLPSDKAGVVTEAEQPRLQDDFHASVNAQWLQSTPIADGQSNVSSFSLRNDEVKTQILTLLVDDAQPSHEAELSRNLFAIAQDMERRNELAMSPIAQEAADIAAITDTAALTAYLSRGDLFRLSPLMGIGELADFGDSTRYITTIVPVELSLQDSAEYTGERTERGKRYDEADRTAFTALYAHLTGNADEGGVLYDAMLAFETELAPAVLTKQDTLQNDYYSRIYNVFTEEELLVRAGNFPLKEMMAASGYLGSPAYMVFQPAWLDRMNELYDQEHVEGFKALLLYQLLMGVRDALDQTCMDIADAWTATVTGTQGIQTLEERNYDLVSSLLPMQVGRMFVDACFTEETRQDILDIISEVVAVYHERLAKADWLSDATREKAAAKLDGMKLCVGYPDTWPDVSSLTINAGDTLPQAIAAIQRWSLDRDTAKIGSKVENLDWSLSPQTVNAFYMPNNNSINILPGILGGAFYTPGGAREANLAGIGTIIGHEITHAFDENGSQFDENGNMVSWWTEEDRAAFLERTGKVAAYYSTIEALPGKAIDGSIKVNEAVADLGGLSCMLEIARDTQDFDYQLFFETFARMWKMKETDHAFETHVMTNAHPENYLRTNIGVQQFEEFYTAFGVKEGDGMYLAPEERLSVW